MAAVIVAETERLRLRQMVEGDAPFVLELLNDPGFIANVADRGVRTIDEATDYIREKIQASYAAYGFGFYVVELREAATPLGICGLVKREALEHVDIGYALLARYTGNGYALEAAKAVMELARTTFGLTRIVAITSPHNDASGRLLEKLGLRFERFIQMPGFSVESKLYG